MGEPINLDAAASFDPLRPKLVRVAYRMLGSVADAEDVVQEAFIRWLGTDRTSVKEPQAYLRRVVTRLCLDVMKSAAKRREVYPGTWLPEPIVAADEDEIDDVTLPLMMALERLSPLERAAFILHDVFGVGFDEISDAIGRDPAACRQLASRARDNVRAERPRFDVPKQRGLEIAEAFFAASRSGDMSTLQAMLAADVAMYSDGGGKKSAASAPIIGLGMVMRLNASLAHVFAKSMSKIIRYAFIDGLPGFISLEGGDTLQTTAFDIRDGKVVGIYVMRNPDKLAHLPEATLH
ncbi:MAG: sigma-70 family RNA polymerase sigma factor [Rhizobiaceae bacterium]